MATLRLRRAALEQWLAQAEEVLRGVQRTQTDERQPDEPGHTPAA